MREKPNPSVPKAVIRRLSLYLRELQRLQGEGLETTSSTRLGQRLGVTDAQIRKDLAHFGQFGYPGIGYRCAELIGTIKVILGTDRAWPVAVAGVGNLGRALLRYKGFEKQGFRIVAAFDVAETLIGEPIEGIRVHNLNEASEVIAKLGIRLAILAVPAAAAQEVASSLVAAGIEGILSFAPTIIPLPDHVRSVRVDLAIELEQLSFAVVNRRQK